jgi:hypothetical protein
MILSLLEAIAAVALFPNATASRVPPPPAPRPMITVHLQSGRTFSGDVDFQTDEHEFVLRTALRGGTFVRPIQWDRVVRVEIAGQVISGTQLHEIVVEIRRTHPKPHAGRADRSLVDASG